MYLHKHLTEPKSLASVNFLLLFSYGQLHKNSPLKKPQKLSSSCKEEAENIGHDALMFRIQSSESLVLMHQTSYNFLR